MDFLNIFKKKPKEEDSIVPFIPEEGETGTEISSGILQEEYNTDLDDVAVRSKKYQVMRNESKLYGLLSAVKLPILSANWFWEAGGDSDDDIRNRDFLQKALFNTMDTKWNKTLSQLLSFIDYGFYYNWINFKVNEEGEIVWKNFAPRQQTAHYKWLQDDKGELIGIQQQLLDAHGDDSQPIMKIKDANGMTRVMMLSYNEEGDNYEGRSVLRGCYQSYSYKKLAMEVTAVNIERFGVPALDITMESMNATDIALAKNLGKNYRSTNKSYVAHSKSVVVDFLQPERDLLGQRMENFINTMNREMETAFLAKFLGSGDQGEGSNAKSKTDVSFFQLSLQQYAKIIQDQINELGKQLLVLNFGEQENYPKLEVTEIKEKDIEQFSSMIVKLNTAGFITADEKKMIDYIREELNLPEITDDEFEEMQNKKAEEKAKIEEIQSKIAKDPNAKDPIVKEKKKGIPKKKEKKENAEKEEGFFLADIKQVKLKESIFQKTINKEEDYLQGFYKKRYAPMIDDIEKELRVYLEGQYKKAKTEVIAGINIIKRSSNTKLRIETIKTVRNKLAGFTDILEGEMMDEIHETSMDNAVEMIRDVDKRVELAEFIVSKGELNSFLAGYKSNVRGIFLPNGGDGRRIEEKIFDNFTQENDVKLAIKQAKQTSFNRSVFKLSVLSHPRGIFRRSVELKGDKEGIQDYKMIAPSKVVKTISLFGAMALGLYLIKSKKEWNEKYGTKDNVNVVGGLGMHHNSKDYYMPVWQDERAEQDEISREQRKELDEVLDQ